VEDELRKMRRQDAITSTALIGAVTAGAVVDANGNKQQPAAVAKTDTIVKVVRDTVYVRDTIHISPKENTDKLAVTAPVVKTKDASVPELRTARIYFSSGSAAISKNANAVLNKAAAWMLQNPGKKVMLTGLTDATGSPELNKKLAGQRIDAVRKAMVQRGIDAKMFEQDVKVSNIKTNQPSASNRRVDMKAIQ
jgi:outer membrane protein OmpA-like peptidoglycan-associated protein